MEMKSTIKSKEKEGSLQSLVVIVSSLNNRYSKHYVLHIKML